MEKHKAHLKQLKDYNETLSQERKDRALREKEMQRILVKYSIIACLAIEILSHLVSRSLVWKILWYPFCELLLQFQPVWYFWENEVTFSKIQPRKIEGKLMAAVKFLELKVQKREF